MEQIKCLRVKQSQHNGNHAREDQRKGVGQKEGKYFLRLIAHGRNLVGQDELRQTGDISEQREPCLHGNRLIGRKLETVKQVADTDRAAADQFQVEVTGTGSEQPHQDGNEKQDRIVDDGAEHGRNIHEETDGERSGAGERKRDQFGADDGAVMTEQTLSGAGF